MLLIGEAINDLDVKIKELEPRIAKYQSAFNEKGVSYWMRWYALKHLEEDYVVGRLRKLRDALQKDGDLGVFRRTITADNVSLLGYAESEGCSNMGAELAGKACACGIVRVMRICGEFDARLCS